MEFSARRRGEIHEGSVPFLPASMDCAPQDLERLFARPFRLSGHIVWKIRYMYQEKKRFLRWTGLTAGGFLGLTAPLAAPSALRVLKIDGPTAQGFLSLTGLWPEG